MRASQARQILLGKQKKGAPVEVRFRPIADASEMRQHRRMEPKVEALMATLVRTSELLRRHGDTSVAARLQDLETRLASGDWTAVESAVTEATGSMGSLRDRWLSVANGDAITNDQEQAVNTQLGALVRAVERTAREAAEALGFQLSC